MSEWVSNFVQLTNQKHQPNNRMEDPKPKRKPGRPRKNPLPTVVEVVMPVLEPLVEICIDDLPALEECPESPARPSTPVLVTGPTGPPEEPELPAFEHYQPPEPPLRFPSHLSIQELRIQMTKYADICGGRMKQLVGEWDRRFPLRR